MGKIIWYKSFGEFNKIITNELINDEKEHITIKFDKDANISNLFSIGRIINLINLIKSDKYGRHITFDFRSKTGKGSRGKLMFDLGVVEYCRKNNIECYFDEHPGILLPRLDLNSRQFDVVLLPIRRIDFEGPFATEREAFQVAERILNGVARDVIKRMSKLNLDWEVLRLELGSIIHVLFRELVSNSLLHSLRSGSQKLRKGSILFALTLKRVASTSGRPELSGFKGLPGDYYYDFFLSDSGDGIYPTVENSFRSSRETLDLPYFNIGPFLVENEDVNRTERHLLGNLFRGDLALRKGRKSLGLHQIAETVSLFEGQLSLHSGRTEIQIQGPEGITPIKVRDQSIKSNINYIPGVVVGCRLRSYHMRDLWARRAIAHDQSQAFTPAVLPHLVRLENHFVGLFGGLGFIDSPRPCELDALDLTTKFINSKSLTVKSGTVSDANGQYTIILEIPLNNNREVDTRYLDFLLQELVKLEAESRNRQLGIIRRIVFSDVPLKVVQELKNRVCDTLMAVNGLFCPLVDSSGTPHFLGLSVQDGIGVNLQDALLAIYHLGAVPADSLAALIGLKDNKAEDKAATLCAILERMLPSDPCSLFYKHTESNVTWFACQPVKRLVREDRLRRLQSISLKNRNRSQHVEWLRLTASELVQHQKIPFVDNVVGILDRGDSLASAIHRVLRVSSLVGVDLNDREQWSTIDIRNDFIVVIDEIFPEDLDDDPTEGNSKNTRLINFIKYWLVCHNSTALSAKKGTCTSRAFLRGIVAIRVASELVTPHPKSGAPCIVVGCEVINETEHSTAEVKEAHYIPIFMLERENNLEDQKIEHVKTIPAHYFDNPLVLYKNNIAVTGIIRYSNIELSSEFWHNASELNLVTHLVSGRENRSVLFYENNEAMIRHPRTRNYLLNFISRFVRSELTLHIDVILHPSHYVGRYLADRVADTLPKRPLIFELPQIQYGGKITPTQKDYEDAIDAISVRSEEMKRPRLRALIVDDSVLSGGSLYTMLGVASKLGLEVEGILVMLNRLTPEVSSSFDALPLKFNYFYRLHMPVPEDVDFPDRKLLEDSSIVEKTTNSFLARHWAERIKPNGLYAPSRISSFVEQTNDRGFPDASTVRKEVHKPIENPIVEQILFYLILNPRLDNIGCFTRIGIAYNFLEILKVEPAFYEALNVIFSHAKGATRNSPPLVFLRAVLFILAFSRHGRDDVVRESLKKLCCNIVAQSLKHDNWTETAGLASECIMILGKIGFQGILGLISEIPGGIWSNALTRLQPVLKNNEALSGDVHSKIETEQENAFDILGAFAWALEVKSDKGFDKPQTINSIDERLLKMFEGFKDEEHRILLIDILAPIWRGNQSVKNILGIQSDPRLSQDIETLLENRLLISYLQDAPGYHATLRLILKFCQADTVLLFFRNRGHHGTELEQHSQLTSDEDAFHIRVFETRDERRPGDSKSPDDSSTPFRPETFFNILLPQDIEERMRAGQLFCQQRNLHPELSKYIDHFAKGQMHEWCLGIPVNQTEGEMEYYVVLGYAKRTSGLNLTTSYSYWMEYEQVLRKVLPAIHARYVNSSRQWNAVIQSLSPIHSLSGEGNHRRDVLRLALSSLNVADLLRKAVGMAYERPYTLEEIHEHINEVVIEKILRKSADSLHLCFNISEEDKRCFDLDIPQIRVAPFYWPPHSPIPLCALHMPVLEFVLIEAVCNALSYMIVTQESEDNNFIPAAEVTLLYLSGDERRGNSIQVRVTNKCSGVYGKRRNGTGIKACLAACHAVGGAFEVFDGMANGVWTTTITLPVYEMPEDLRRMSLR